MQSQVVVVERGLLSQEGVVAGLVEVGARSLQIQAD